MLNSKQFRLMVKDYEDKVLQAEAARKATVSSSATAAAAAPVETTGKPEPVTDTVQPAAAATAETIAAAASAVAAAAPLFTPLDYYNNLMKLLEKEAAITQVCRFQNQTVNKTKIKGQLCYIDIERLKAEFKKIKSSKVEYTELGSVCDLRWLTQTANTLEYIQNNWNINIGRKLDDRNTLEAGVYTNLIDSLVPLIKHLNEQATNVTEALGSAESDAEIIGIFTAKEKERKSHRRRKTSTSDKEEAACRAPAAVLPTEADAESSKKTCTAAVADLDAPQLQNLKAMARKSREERKANFEELIKMGIEGLLRR
jgi:hypothetical protein